MSSLKHGYYAYNTSLAYWRKHHLFNISDIEKSMYQLTLKMEENKKVIKSLELKVYKATIELAQLKNRLLTLLS